MSNQLQAIQEYLQSFEKENKKLVDKGKEFERLLFFMNQHAEFHECLVKKFLYLQNENQELKKALTFVKNQVPNQLRALKGQLATIRNMYENIPFSGFSDLWEELVSILSQNRMKCVNDLWRKNNNLQRYVGNLREKCRLTEQENKTILGRSSSMNSEKKKLMEEIKRLRHHNHNLEEENQRLRSGLEKSVDRERKLSNEISSLNAQKGKQVDVVETLKTTNLRNTTSLQRSETKIMTLEHESRQFQELLERLGREKVSLLKNITQLENDKTRLERKIGEQRNIMRSIAQGVRNVRQDQVKMMHTMTGQVRNCMENGTRQWAEFAIRMKRVMDAETRRRDGIDNENRMIIARLRNDNRSRMRDASNLRQELRESIDSFSRLESKYWDLSKKYHGNDFE